MPSQARPRIAAHIRKKSLSLPCSAAQCGAVQYSNTSRLPASQSHMSRRSSVRPHRDYHLCAAGHGSPPNRTTHQVCVPCIFIEPSTPWCRRKGSTRQTPVGVVMMRICRRRDERRGRAGQEGCTACPACTACTGRPPLGASGQRCHPPAVALRRGSLQIVSSTTGVC